MARNYFDRYIWLIETIQQHQPIPFEQISNFWETCPLNDRRGEPLSNRTFFNHIDAILQTFGIEIKCRRPSGYYIANEDDIDGGGIRQWMLDSLSLNNLLSESKDMRGRILFEKIPSSQKWLTTLVNAMRSEQAVELTYQSFTRDEPHSFLAHPYCLKVFKQRWYVLARSEEYRQPRIYALDERMVNVRLLDKKLHLPARFNAEAFFADYFGIIADGNKAETVELKVTAGQVKYFESLPLHASQEVVESTPEHTLFRYRLVPTYDFKQEILRHGPRVEVLAPDWFRDELRSDIEAMARHYAQ